MLDLVVSDPSSGAPLYVDAVVRCAHSDNPGRLQARVRADGLAAAEAAMGKRRRYAQASASLVPSTFEDRGRPAEEAVAVCMLGAARMLMEVEQGSADWGGTAQVCRR